MNNASWRRHSTDAEMPDREYPFADIYPQTKRRRILPRPTVRGWFALLTFAAAIGIVIYEAFAFGAR